MTTLVRRSEVAVGSRRLGGALELPDNPSGLVLFAHGSGSSRYSPRNAFVAEALLARGFATLLMDLLTRNEARDRRNVFDIPLLAGRVVEAIDWIAAEPALARAADRPLRRQHRRGRRSGRRRAASRAHRRRRLARRTPRSRRRGSRARHARRLCSSSARSIMKCWSSIANRRDSCPTRGSMSCPARRICSRSPGRWSASSRSRPIGSRRSCRDAARADA